MTLISRKSLLILAILLTSLSFLYPDHGIGFVATACWIVYISNLIARPIASAINRPKSKTTIDISAVIAFNSQFKYQASKKLSTLLLYLLGASIFITCLQLAIILSPILVNYGDSLSSYFKLLDLTIYPNAILVIATGAVFFTWIYRISSNSHALYHDQQFEFSPKWNVGIYFIPLVNIFSPFDAMQDIWRTNMANSKTTIVANWWSFYVVAALMTVMTKDMHGTSEAIVYIAAKLLSCISNVLAMIIVKKLYQSQTAKAAQS